jgi:hypothetical protein
MKSNPRQNPLAKFDREQYADWLWRGLQAFYETPAERAYAFEPHGLLIVQQESVCEGLAQVYGEYVPQRKKLMFRRAIGDVLREQANNHEAPIDACRDLIYLLARIRANESLGALLPAVGNGFVGKRLPAILYETFAALRLLAPSWQAYEAARDLAYSANFDDGYLFEATKVLIECEPSRVAEIVLEFEPRLSKLREDCKRLGDHDGDEWTAFCEAANDWAQYLLTFGPGTWLNEFWQKVDHTADQLWIFQLLFGNKAVPVTLAEDESSGKYAIVYDHKRTPLQVPAKSFWTLQSILTLAASRELQDWTADREDIANTTQVDSVSESGEVKGSQLLGVAIGGSVAHLYPQPLDAQVPGA